LVTMEGEEWKLQRRIITPLFHLNSLKQSFPFLVANCKLFLERLEASNRVLDGMDELNRLTMGALIDKAFGGRMDKEWMFSKWHDLTNEAGSLIMIRVLFGDLLNYLPLPAKLRHYRLCKEIAAKVDEVTKLRRQELASGTEEPSDLIGIMLKANDPSVDQKIADQAMNFMLAGSETSAILFAWIFYWLSKHPDVQEKLYAEVSTVLGDRDPTIDDLNNLQYCKQVSMEALRICVPTYGTDKIAAEDCYLNGQFIPKGTCVFVFHLGIQMHPTFWKNPEQFIPERFDPDKVKEQHSHAFLAFAAGDRNCIGQKFALYESQVVLAMLMQRYTVKLANTKDIAWATTPLLLPMNLRVQFTPRKRS